MEDSYPIRNNNKDIDLKTAIDEAKKRLNAGISLFQDIKSVKRGSFNEMQNSSMTNTPDITPSNQSKTNIPFTQQNTKRANNFVKPK